MFNTVTLILLLGFGFAADVTVRKIDWEQVPPLFEIPKEIEENVLYFDRIEKLGDDMYLPIKDSTYVYTIKNENNKRKSNNTSQ